MEDSDRKDIWKMPPIELRDLRWAITTSQHRSLRQAAATLKVRQSTLSRRLRDLEHCLGASLFTRTNGGTRPTAMGQEFVDAMSQIIEDVGLTCSRLKSRSSGECGLLKIGVCTSFSTGNLRATLAEHHRRFPNVDVQIVDGSVGRLLSELTGDNLDVVFSMGPLWYERWADRTLPLWSERVIVALPSHHPLGERHTVRWRELRGERFLVPLGGVTPEFEYLLTIKLRGIRSVRTQQQAAGLDRLLSLVGIGYGVLLVLEGATGASYKDVIYREVVDFDGPTRFDFGACWREANDNPALVPFLDTLRERYPDLSRAVDRN